MSPPPPLRRPIAQYYHHAIRFGETADDYAGSCRRPYAGLCHFRNSSLSSESSRSSIYTVMSSVDVDGPPDAKRFRIDVNTQVGVDAPSVSTSCTVATPLAGEASQEGQSPAAPSSASYRSSNGSVVSTSDSPVKEEESELLNDESEGSSVGGSSTASGLLNHNHHHQKPSGGPCDLLDMLSKTMLSGVFGGNIDDVVGGGNGNGSSGISRPQNLLKSISSSPTPQGIPGALAVAQTPAAQLFANDDWSWHRNPAASIRSGGTNKQTPVWKYFVYNKAENLSRCIVGDCTYMLKGPHTSTLACHLKKHTVEYSEFQKLKAEYSRSKMEIQANQPKESHQDVISPGMDLSIKPQKPKKEQMSSPPKSLHDMNFLFRPQNHQQHQPQQHQQQSQHQSQQQQQVNQPATSQAMLQNMMMSMNPLQMMLAHTLPTSSTTALQQAGLQLSANGQIVQSKKWRGDDKKQRELQTRLALALSTSHIHFDVLYNPIWRDLLEIAQPKFNFNNSMSSDLDHTINSISARLFQSIKSIIGNSKKINLLVDVCSKDVVSRITISAAIQTNNNYEPQIVLLAARNLQQNADNAAEEISRCVEQVCSEYSINYETMINRVVCSGLKSFVGDDCSNILDKQIEAFGSRLLATLNCWLETSQHVDTIRKSMFTMIFSVIANQTALQLATKINGGKFDIPITEPFPILIETIISMRDSFQLHQIDSFIGMSDSQWHRLAAIHHICNLFKPFITFTNEMQTIDTVLPTVQQIKHALDKDIYHLGSEMAGEFADILQERMAFVIDPENEEFDSTYCQATALNPQLAVVLNCEQMQTARKLIEKEVSKRSKRKEGGGANKKLSIGVDSILANVIKGNTDGMNIYNELFQTMTNQVKEEETKENIVGQYFDEISNSSPVESIFNPLLRSFGNPMQAPLSYWKSCSQKCAELSDYAQELLSIPMFTVSTERCHNFNSNPSPYHQLNHQIIVNNLENPELFEKQTLLRFNRQIVTKLL